MQSPLHNLKLLKLKFCKELLGKKPCLSFQCCQPHVLGLSLREANGRRSLSTAEPPPQEPASRVEELHLCQEIWRLCGSLGDSWPHLDTCILHRRLEEKACVLGPTHSPGEDLHWAQHQWEMGVPIERLPLQGASLHDHIGHGRGPDTGPLASWLSTPESKANFMQSSRKNWANLVSLPLLQTKTQCSIRRPVAHSHTTGRGQEHQRRGHGPSAITIGLRTQCPLRKKVRTSSHSSVTQSCLTLWPHARPPCPSPSPGVYSNSCPLSQWCRPPTSSSVIPFSFRLQSFPTSGSFQMSQFFKSGG